MTTPTTPTPPEYTTGWLKQDVGNTMAVAIRTNIETTNYQKDWGVMTVDHGGHYATWNDVQNWPDVTSPPGVVADLGGDGTLSATVTPQIAVAAGFGGDGALSATAT